MAVMTAYDLVRLTPGGVRRSHHETKIVTEGPWLIIGREETFELIVPAHAVVELAPCEGRCRDGRE